MKMLRSMTLALALAAGTAGGVLAQGIHISPAVGAYIPASDLESLRSGAEQARLERSATMGLGLNVDIGWIRGSLAYASGAEISEEGTSGDIGDGSVLVAAADLVLRPIPRVYLQPYLLGGVGFKRQDYSFDDEGVSGDILPEDRSDVAVHVGLGADLMLGRFGVFAEVSDYISRDQNDEWGQHDAFVLVGLRFGL